MSWQYAEKAMVHSKAKGPARMVLFIIATHADNDGRAYPGIERIRERANMSRRSVFEAIDRLVALGELERVHKGGASGSNLYLLRLGEGGTEQESAPSEGTGSAESSTVRGSSQCEYPHRMDGTVRESAPCEDSHRNSGTVRESAPPEGAHGAENNTVRISSPCENPHRNSETVRESAPSEGSHSAENNTVRKTAPCEYPHSDGAEIRTHTVRKFAPEQSGKVNEPSYVWRSDAAPPGGDQPHDDGSGLDIPAEHPPGEPASPAGPPAAGEGPPGSDVPPDPGDEPAPPGEQGPVIRLPTRDGGEWELRNGTLAEFSDGFPRLDVVAELRKARVWLLSNPAKRKTQRGMPRFVASWLGRAERDLVVPARHAGGRASPTGRRRALAGGLTEEDRHNTALWE